MPRLLLASLAAIVPLVSAYAFVSDFEAPENLPEHPDLPDALTMRDGSKVETPDDWFDKRRPELKHLFSYYMYGYAPECEGVESRIEREDKDCLGGKATLRQVEIAVKGLGEGAPRIHLALFIPNNRTAPAPIFIAINKCGNYRVLDDDRIIINPDAWVHPECKEGGYGAEKDFWCIETLIDRGYAFGIFHESDADPDKEDWTDGFHAQYMNTTPPGSEWGTIRCWAWGLSRCVDYLVTDADIDKDRICVTGHSRRGKTALLAAAFDERFALVVPHQSGTGGSALSRNNDQETVERINRVFPHWFNDNFAKFSDHESKLPIDQHLLMSLVAPRALLDTGGLQDKWANYPSALKSVLEVDKVYKFLGSTGVKGDGLLELGEPVNAENAGNLLQYRLDTKHTLNADYWKAILDFADLNLKTLPTRTK